MRILPNLVLKGQRAKSFAQSVVSRGIVSTVKSAVSGSNCGARVDELTYQLRRLSCFGNGADIPSCPKLALGKHGHYCNACGCGDRSIASLDGDDYTKLHYPFLNCPLKRPGFSNAPP